MKIGKLDVCPVCPTCGEKCNGYANLKDAKLPKPGDLAVCASCLEVLVYKDDFMVEKLPENMWSDDVIRSVERAKKQINLAKYYQLLKEKRTVH